MITSQALHLVNPLTLKSISVMLHHLLEIFLISKSFGDLWKKKKLYYFPLLVKPDVLTDLVIVTPIVKSALKNYALSYTPIVGWKVKKVNTLFCAKNNLISICMSKVYIYLMEWMLLYIPIPIFQGTRQNIINRKNVSLKLWILNFSKSDKKFT